MNPVIRQGSPPNGLISHNCSADPFFGVSADLAAEKAIYFPSGDHFGEELLSFPRVSCTSFPSARLVRNRFEMLRSFSLSGTLLTHTTHRLSGEISNDEACSASTTSSAVHIDTVVTGS